MDEFPPSIGAHALARLRSAILTAELKPDARLRIRELSERYKIGPGPLREALTVLSGDGLVIFERQRGFRVSPASREDFCDVASTRQAVESLALQKSVEQGTPQWREHLRESKRRFDEVMEKVGETAPISDEWETRHRAYHRALISACGSPTLIRFSLQLHDRFDRYRRISIPSKGIMANTATEEEEIVAAALAGDARQASTLLKQHISTMAALILEHFPS
jgi:GntR family transcriptional regulator, carbon starvation induced regulator